MIKIINEYETRIMPKFNEGDILKLKEGWFRIAALGDRFIKLENIPKPRGIKEDKGGKNE